MKEYEKPEEIEGVITEFANKIYDFSFEISNIDDQRHEVVYALLNVAIEIAKDVSFFEDAAKETVALYLESEALL